MSEHDLTRLLNQWPHEGGRVNARIIEGDDGEPRLQVRIELGILQMTMTGRPDGHAPEGRDSWLTVHIERLGRYRRETGDTVGFVLSSAECRMLREEAIQLYHRYVALFALGRYELVVRDTRHALLIMSLCRDFGETEHDRFILDQFMPSVLTMRARAEAEQAIKESKPRDALAALDQGLRELRELYDQIGPGDVEDFDTMNEVQLLRGMRDALVPKLPASQRVELQERLRAAIDAENYELAAILRDELRLLHD